MPENKIIFFFFAAQIDMAKKYPITAEHKVCKKTAPTNLIM